ncbi:MAG: endonuclease/exonuclease/phosphatase family protein [Rhodocyclaceae bacterium]
MKLLTWNIQWGRGCDGRVDFARLAGEIRRIADADVICLQEVAVNLPDLPGSAGEDGVALLRDAFPRHEAFYGVATDLPCARGGRSRFGNLILSRLPVLQVFRHLLPWPIDPAVPSMQRICVEVVVAARFGPLRVLTTHLEYYSALQRMAQVEALREIHRTGGAHARSPRSRDEPDSPFAVLARGEAALLCGDFNFGPDAPEHARLSAPFDDETPGLVDCWQCLHPGLPQPPTAGAHEAASPGRQHCCDFVFASENLTPRLASIGVDGDTEASDHQPVVLELAQ